MNNKVLKITIIDDITGIEGHGTVVMIEPDPEMPDISWIYCVSDNPEMNIQYEPKLNAMIWRIIASISPYYLIKEENING